MNWKTNKVQVFKFLICTAVLLTGQIISSCNFLANWRNSQINASNRAATAGTITPPAKPVVVPATVTRSLPIPEQAVVLEYLDYGDHHYVKLLSPTDALGTCTWMISRLAQLGYESGDNPSRILDGVEFANGQSKFPRMFVKVDLNVREQCTIELKAFKK